jgi:ribosomal protein S18 acetylase RimI-like enzyme
VYPENQQAKGKNMLPLDDFSHASVLKAMEANVQQAWTRFGSGLGAEVHEEPEILWFLSTFPFHLANGIVRTHLPEHAVEDRLKQFTAFHLPIAWLVSPSTQPASLGTRLEQQGWMRDDAPGMALDLSSLDELPPHPSQLTITRVSDVEHLTTWLRVMTVGSQIPEAGLKLLLDMVARQGMPESTTIHYYLGWLADRPVATSLLFCGGGVAGIYNVATLPEERRQGIGRALTLAALWHARTLGYRMAVLQASPMGRHLYHCLGFREYGTFHAYFSPEE